MALHATIVFLYAGTSPFKVFFGREPNYNLHPKVADDKSVSEEKSVNEVSMSKILNKRIAL